MTIDTHLHLWDLTVSEYAWLPPEGPLHTTFTAERARSELDAAGVAAAVLVQAEDSAADTEFLLAQAGAHNWVAGVVGWVRLDDPATAECHLDSYQGNPAFRGVRHLVHDDPRDEFLALPAVRRSLALLAERGLPFDVPDAWPRHLGRTAELAAALPGLTIVLDHLGKPPRDPDGFAAWLRVMRDVASRPNTVAKLSGLQMPGAPFTVAAVRPAVEAAFELFGPDRLMYGGDWPMTVHFGGYGPAWEVYSAFLDELSGDERARVTSGTANAVYGVPERAR
ncbi:amidohydrolase family protein [Amycolatopsis acidiphila]|uniref:Amidohydrolase family protein n=1 Tax=Amycolatopsis acidiphila TaxID=715473 RepID=A0A558A473_9PSEU|nr:amidohydrolase family protein [Amycolatopsis acidiphila]TVT19046.1 amidohydrolase family protein [Amycolatopsis acidiphila]UIJ63713.1 amidohydrolase family protein [Amycolatopsis acidiphila]GHG67284.1 metal-dependent hydrolase [Amycolatopsis acidiphila]